MCKMIKAIGHKNVRLTHDKTIEFTTDTDLTPKGTCIAGLCAQFDVAALRRLVGEVVSYIKIDEEVFEIKGKINPDFSSGDKVIFRRSDVCDAATLLINCDKLAADMPRTMVDKLTNGADIEVTFDMQGSQVPVQRQSAPYTNGGLYLVGVPIGNDKDLTPQAKELLETADVIAAEDTRRAKALFQRLGLDTMQAKLIAHHEHNERASSNGIKEFLAKGQKVVLISDAGMPGISDPGYVLATEVIPEDVPVVPVSGPNAALLALVASGLPTDQFSFIGFLPRAKGAKTAKLKEIEQRQDTLIFYEAPHRILETLETIQETLGDRQACLARELTKVHEEFLRGSLSAIYQALSQRDKILGEIALVVEGAEELNVAEEALDDEIKALLAEGKRAKEVRDLLAEKYDLPKKEIYAKVLEFKE